MGKDQVTNISTALMAINELSSCYDIPINIHFDAKGHIYVHVGFGTLYRKEVSFYPQDTYRAHSKTDDIYKWIKETVETLAVKKANPVLHATRDENGNLLRGLRAEVPGIIIDDLCDIELGVEDTILLKAPCGYRADWTPPELEKLGIPYPATQEDIEKALRIEHLLDVTCSWQLEKLCGRRLYILMPDCTLDDLTPYERLLLEQSEEYNKKHKE